MARCLRCRAGNEWIEGDVPSASAEREQQLREALAELWRIEHTNHVSQREIEAAWSAARALLEGPK
jgi:hypothetical protein